MAIKSDTISEYTADAGVTIDGVLIKDGSISGMGVGVYNAAAYGASPSASAATNTTAINDALTAGAGAIVEIPVGTYDITASDTGPLFEVPSNTTLRGAGRDSTYLQLAAGQAAGTDSMQVIGTATGATRVVIEGITIDGDSANQTYGAFGISLNSATFCTVRDRPVLDMKATGITAVTDATDNLIENNEVSGWGYSSVSGFGILAFDGCHRTRIIGNYVTGSATLALALRLTPPRRRRSKPLHGADRLPGRRQRRERVRLWDFGRGQRPHACRRQYMLSAIVNRHLGADRPKGGGTCRNEGRQQHSNCVDGFGGGYLSGRSHAHQHSGQPYYRRGGRQRVASNSPAATRSAIRWSAAITSQIIPGMVF